VRRGPPQLGVSLVLPTGAGWCGAGPLDFLKEPAWPFPRERSAAQGIRDDRPALHGRGVGWRRGVRSRRQHDQGRCQPAARRAGQRVASSRDCEPRRAGVSDGSRRCRVRRGNAGRAEVRLARRPGRALDGSQWRARLLCLLHQLPDRPEARRHRRCRGDNRRPTGRGDGAAADDRSHTGALWPVAGRLAADAAYGSAENLAWLVHQRGIEPHIPVFDNSQRTDGTYSRDDFTYDHKRDCYICPAGKDLRQRQKIYRLPRPFVDDNGMMRYRASKLDCDGCALKPRCCPNAPARKILRSIHEGARDMARDIAGTEAYATSRCERKKIEMLFAHLKHILKLDRLRLRGPNGARDEFHLAAAAQNLRKLAKLTPLPALSKAA